MHGQPITEEYERYLLEEFRRGRVTRADFLRRALGAGISVSALGAFLSSCGGGGGGEDAESLRILTTGEPYGTAMKKVAAEWGKTKGIEVSLDQLAYDQTYERLVLLNQGESTDYDLEVSDCIWFATFMYNDWAVNLDEFAKDKATKIDLNAFVPGAVDGYGRDVEGALYSIPVTFGGEIYAYRDDIYKRAGITSTPRTFDELNEALPKIHDLEPGVGAIISLPNEQDATYSEWTLRLMGADLPPNARQFVWDNDFKPIFNDGNRGLTALEYWLDVKPYTQAGVDEAGYADGIQTFSQGRAATMINWAVFFLDFEAPGAATAGKLRYALPPQHVDATDPKFYLSTFQLFINPRSEKKDAAYELMTYLATPEAQEKMLNEDQPDPYLSAPYQEGKWIDRFPWFEALSEMGGKLVPLNDRIKEYVEMQRIFYEDLQAAWFGRRSPEDVMAALPGKLESFFDERGYSA